MITTVEALPEGEFQSWLTAVPATADAGKSLLQKHGCLGCHSLDGPRLVGPTFQGIGGRRVEVIRGGTESILTTDRSYLEESILQPNAGIVAGYPPAMPSYSGKIPDAELAAIVDYLLSLQAAATQQSQQEHDDAPRAERGQPTAPPPPEAPAESPAPSRHREDVTEEGAELAGKLGCLGCHSTDGSRLVGPSFKGLFGQPRQISRDGKDLTVTADAGYLTRAIREPMAEIVAGYPPAMPPFAQLSDTDIKLLLTWLESLK